MVDLNEPLHLFLRLLVTVVCAALCIAVMMSEPLSLFSLLYCASVAVIAMVMCPSIADLHGKSR
jgi:hypothetical protein